MSISDSIDPDTEAYELQLKLAHGLAENARLDAEELLDAGFEVVQVSGLPDVLWKKDGVLDGALFTTAAALEAVGPSIPDPRDEGA